MLNDERSSDLVREALRSSRRHGPLLGLELEWAVTAPQQRSRDPRPGRPSTVVGIPALDRGKDRQNPRS